MTAPTLDAPRIALAVALFLCSWAVLHVGFYERDQIVDACFKRGLLVLGAGKNSIRISPPLVLTKAQAATAVEIIDAAMGESAV